MNNKKIKVFECFSGYGSQSLALRNIGVNYEIVGISEIDKWAIEAYMSLHNTSPNINLGDVSKIDVNTLPNIDLFTYSFPCQDISICGKQRGLDENSGTRSSLLWECKKIIETKKPSYLLMENVKNLVGNKHKPNFERWIKWLETQGYKNYWEILNAKDFGVPQNRERVFMVSILNGTKDFEFPKSIPLKKRVKDILDKNVDSKYFVKGIDKFTISKKNSNYELLIEKKYKDIDNKTIFLGGYENINNKRIGQSNRVFDVNGIACCQAANGGGRGGKTGLYLIDFSNNQNKIPIDINETNLKKIGVLSISKYEQSNRVYSVEGISPTLLTKEGCKVLLEIDKDKKYEDANYILFGIRRLTPNECGRLMGLNNNDLEKINKLGFSDNKKYTLYGNSIVIPVLEAIFKKMEEIYW